MRNKLNFGHENEIQEGFQSRLLAIRFESVDAAKEFFSKFYDVDI